MGDEATFFEFIDFYDGLNYQAIRKSNLRFIDLHAEDFDGIEQLKKDEFHLKVGQFRVMSWIKKQELLLYAPLQSSNGSPTGGKSGAVNDNRRPVDITNNKDHVSSKFDVVDNLTLLTKNQNVYHEIQDTSSITIDQPFEFCPPSSDPPQFSTSISQELELVKGFTNNLMNPTQEIEIHTTSMYNSVWPLDREIELFQQLKKPKIDSIQSDNFGPMSSELHILTSEPCLEF